MNHTVTARVTVRRVLLALYLIASIATLLYTIGAPTEIPG